MKAIWELEQFLKRNHDRLRLFFCGNGKFEAAYGDHSGRSSTLAGALENLLIEMQTAKAKEPVAVVPPPALPSPVISQAGGGGGGASGGLVTFIKCYICGGIYTYGGNCSCPKKFP